MCLSPGSLSHILASFVLLSSVLILFTWPCVVVFSCPVRRHFTFFTRSVSILFSFGLVFVYVTVLLEDKIVTCLQDEESKTNTALYRCESVERTVRCEDSTNPIGGIGVHFAILTKSNITVRAALYLRAMPHKGGVTQQFCSSFKWEATSYPKIMTTFECLLY